MVQNDVILLRAESSGLNCVIIDKLKTNLHEEVSVVAKAFSDQILISTERNCHYFLYGQDKALFYDFFFVIVFTPIRELNMLTEVEPDEEPTTAESTTGQRGASCDGIGAEGSAAASSVKGRRICGGNGSRASFSTKSKMSEGDCKSLFSYRV